jgi:DNA processing protein
VIEQLPPSASTFREERPSRARLTRADAFFPKELEDLGDDTPAQLWAEGSVAILEVLPRVAIVGTRRSTSYGERIARELATAFARAGACIVSGLATGIDGTAHRAALDANGTTIAVLGTGLNGCFPKSNRHLQRAIAEKGLLLSELEPSDHGMKFSFLQRNRLIAALSSLTIVVEAPLKSGALNTAEHAIGMNRQLGAVPGPIDQPQSAGCNDLLKLSAQVITSVEDALALVGLTPPPRTPRVTPDGDEGKVWAALASGALCMDSLCHKSGLPVAHCLAAVSKLELSGAIECALTGEIRRR